MPDMTNIPMKRSFLVRYRTRVGQVLALLLIGSLLCLRPPWAGIWYVDIILHSLGFALVIAGVLLRLWCTLYIGGRKDGVLQTIGPYSLVRHPLYVGSLLLAIGFAFYSESPVVLAVMLVYFILQYRTTIRHEEATLTALFGEQHAEYCRTVPCFIPRLSGFDPTPPASISFKQLRGEIVHCVVFLALLPIFELIQALQRQGLLDRITLTHLF